MRQNKSKTVKSKTIPSQTTNHQKNIEYIEQKPSLGSSIFQGFSFGIGSSIAHNIFDSKEAKPPIHLHTTIDKTTEFKQCMERTYSNYEECACILK